MSRKSNRTAISTGCDWTEGPFFVVVNEKDNRYYEWSLQPVQKNRKISAQGQHRIARTGYPGQDNRTAPLGQDIQLKHPGISYMFTKA